MRVRSSEAAPPVTAATPVATAPSANGERITPPGSSAFAGVLRRFVHDHLGSLKTPEVLVVTDELPHTATGKILRREVRADLSERG